MSLAEGKGRPRLVGVLALVASGLVLLFVLVSLSLDEGESDRVEISGAGAVQRLLGGIPQDGAVLGYPDAPVTVEVFNDLQCETCADYQLETIAPLIEGPVRDGEVKLSYHHFSMTDQAPGIAFYRAVAAGKQDYQWQFIQLFFLNQDEARGREVTDDFLDQVGGAILNFNVEQWQREFDGTEVEDPEVEEAVEADDRLSAERGLPAEPAVVVSGPGGSRELIQSPSLTEITEAIDQVS